MILTVRGPEKWYASAKSTIYTFRDRTIGSDEPITRMGEELIWKNKFKDKFDDKEHTIKVFNEHYEEVKRYVPEDRLLVFSVKEGWEPLCKFLDVPIPETPFPRTAKVADQLSKEIEAGVKDMDLSHIFKK